MTAEEELAWRRERLDAVRLFADRIEQEEKTLVRSVDRARSAGCTWAEIGGALGCSHQAAIKRFAKRVRPVDLRVKDHPRRAELREKHGWKEQAGAK